MKTNFFGIPQDDHTIPCKEFLPEGEDEVLLAVLGAHGFGGDKDSSMLRALAGQLEPMGGALLCFDFPCHGASTAPDEMLSIDLCRRDLLAAAEETRRRYPGAELGIFATSLGGYVTLLCLDELKDFTVVLRSPAVNLAESFLTLLPDRDEFFEKGQAVCGFERKMLIKKCFYDEILSITVPMPDRPVLVIHGTADDIVPFEYIRAMADRSEHITLCPIEGADHRFKRKGQLESVMRVAVSWYSSAGTL